MTPQEFINTRFRKGDRIVYGGETYYITGIDFDTGVFSCFPFYKIHYSKIEQYLTND